MESKEEFHKRKEWNIPEVFYLDFKKTENGVAIGTTEDDTYHSDSNNI
jgi:hypothetical protein